MSSESSDSDGGNHEDNSQVFVQDYLDLLLATETSLVKTVTSAPKSRKTIVTHPMQRRSSDTLPPLAMVAGTDMKPLAADTQNKPIAVPIMSSEAESENSPTLDPRGLIGVERRKSFPQTRENESQALLPMTKWLNGRPLWAQDRFECLLFRVSGLTLALPLVELAGIYPLVIKSLEPEDERVLSIGLLPIKNGRISVIDTASVVMPDRYDRVMRERFNYVVAVKGMNWGLAVDNIDGAHIQEIDGVQWRSQLTRRPWLAGTVLDRRCAIVEVNQLNAMLQ
ncbi:MAG: chemotaxis protein CheW [Oceanicoccus sp.]